MTGIGIPKDIPIFEVKKDGTIVDTGDSVPILWCHDCLFGSPKNCPGGIFNLCHPENENKKNGSVG